MALFVDRATAANTRFALNDADARIVADICRSLDGIPFAIELAAARVKLMSVAHLAERLSERFRILTGGDRTALPRQQTMRALVDWSYNLLNERERTILNRTAVFAGGWTLEAASEICSDDQIESWEVLDLLSSLVDKSLVVAELGGATERYRLLETTWQYAREKLAAANESLALNRKHAEYFLRIAEAADASFESTPTEKWIAGLEPELDNFRVAMGWALVGKHDVALGARLAAALRDLWISVGSRIEGLRWINLALDASGDAEPGGTMIKLWLGQSVNLEGFGETAEEALEHAVAQAERLGDRFLLGLVLANHGFALDRRGRIDEAQAVYLQAAPILRETTATKQLARVLSWWSITHFVRGESQEAGQGFNEALALAKAVADVQLTATVTGNIAELAFAEGDIAKAVTTGEESAAIRRQTKNPTGLANAHSNLTAYRLALGDTPGAKADARIALQNAREGQSTNMLMCATQHVALIKAREGDPQNAARLLGYVDKMFTESGFSREPTEKWSYEQLTSALKSALRDDEIRSLATEGAGWTEDQVVEEALRI
jgi:tetratricopeptide (TPR) repeat protein